MTFSTSVLAMPSVTDKQGDGYHRLGFEINSEMKLKNCVEQPKPTLLAILVADTHNLPPSSSLSAVISHTSIYTTPGGVLGLHWVGRLTNRKWRKQQ